MTAMEQIAEISCLARDAGMTYGAYISKFGNPFDAVKKPAWMLTLKKNERVCKVCGEVFEVKTGRGYSRRKTCYECEKKRKEKIAQEDKPKRTRTVKEYVVKCSRCGKLTTIRRPPGKWKNFCAECRPLAKKKWREEHDGKQ